MIESIEFPGFIIFKSKIQAHNDIKHNIMNIIDASEGFKVETPSQSLLDTDWYMPREMPRMYLETVGPILDQYNRELFNKLEIKDQSALHISQIWYQRYAKGDFHSMHTHGNCTFSNVYFLDLPEGAPATTFRFMGKDYTVDVEEGDVITFPGHIQHESKPNASRFIKTSIAFNSTLG